VRRLSIALAALALAGCGSGAKVDVAHVLGAHHRTCAAGALFPLGTRTTAYAGVAAHGATAYRRTLRGMVARFGAKNVNDYPTVFGIVGAVVRRDCKPTWYRVELPLKPNGRTAFVRARALQVIAVSSRIAIDVSSRRLTLFRGGKVVLTSPVAVGSPSTPTPYGRFYVNQRLVPTDTGGPFGPGAVGISAFSNVLTGWAQGGPVAIHGTNEPWSIGHAVSNGCIRLPNATLEKVFALAVAGTPVIITP
jgi:lipoprotein-anchoring transpeptidase ErfK/SrfK